jgi:hypothetical protein
VTEESPRDKQKTPLILEQNSRNIKGTQALPYEFGRETYEVYSNPKNPFLGRILGGEMPPLELDAKQAGALLREIGSEQGYRVNFPGAGSAHQKRKVTSGKASSKKGNRYQEIPILPETR